MTPRLLKLAEDAIAFLGAFVGLLLILHMIDRIASGLYLTGVLS